MAQQIALEVLAQPEEKGQHQEEFRNLKIWLEDQEEKRKHTSARVKQDQLAPVNLEEKGKEKIMKLSAELEEDCKQHLVGLLKEYKDVFAWSYLNMEGINPKFNHHKLILKKGAIMVKKKRYIWTSTTR